MANKVENNNKMFKSDKWLLAFYDLNIEDEDLIKYLEDMLDSKILKYAVFQRFSDSEMKEHVELFIFFNFRVTLEALSDRFNFDCFLAIRDSANSCRDYVLRKSCYSLKHYEIGSLEEQKELDQQSKSEVINIKGTDYKIVFQDYLCGSLGVTRPVAKEIFIENSDNIDDLKDTIAHELIHAYFYECGLQQYFDDEILVTWLGKHIFKISETVESLIKGRKK